MSSIEGAQGATVISGTAGDVGQGVFQQIVLPMVSAMSEKAPPDAVMDFYAGLISAVFGGLVLMFGQERGIAMVRDAARAIEDAKFPGTEVH